MRIVRSLGVILISLAVILPVPGVAARASEAECVRGYRDLSEPTVEMQPMLIGLELPPWLKRIRTARWGFAQQGGDRSLHYAAETVSGENGVAVVEIATERFKLAPGWAELVDWLKERIAIAADPNYWPRSRYWITRPMSEHGKPIPGSKVESTYGITWGEYTRADVDGKTDEEIYGNEKIRLPEEKTLRKPIKRYFDSDEPDARGIAFEIRAISKNPESTPDWLRDEGLTQMIRGILEVCKKHPKLYDKPIITCYADANHRGLYEKWLGMKLQEGTTPEHEPLYVLDGEGQPIKKIPWWYIQVSPAQLERVLMARLKGSVTVSNLNQNHLFKLPDGREVPASPQGPIAFDSENHVAMATLANETELQSGLVAASGATAFWEDQHPVRVSAIAKPHATKYGSLEVTAPVGATLEWNSPNLRAWVSENDPNGVYYEPNFDNSKRRFPFSEEWGQSFQLMLRAARSKTPLPKLPQTDTGSDPIHDYLVELNKNARAFREESGGPFLTRWVSEKSNPIHLKNPSLEIYQLELDSSFLTARLAVDSPVEGEIIAAKDTDLELESTSGKWKWTRVCLAQKAIIGKHTFQKGTVLIRTPDGIKAYTGPGNYQVIPADSN